MAYQSGEGELQQQQVCGSLVLPDLPQRLGSWSISVFPALGHGVASCVRMISERKSTSGAGPKNSCATYAERRSFVSWEALRLWQIKIRLRRGVPR